MWLIFCLILVLVHSFSVSQDLETILLTANETAVVEVSRIFTGALLDYEVKADEGLAVTLQYDFEMRETLHLQVASGELGPFLQTDWGDFFVVYSSQWIEVRTSTDGAVIWTTSTSDIDEVAAPTVVGFSLLVYWTASVARDTWEIHCVDFAHLGQIADTAVSTEIAVSAKLLGCSAAPRLFAMHPAGTGHIKVEEYQLNLNNIVLLSSYELPSSSLVDATCSTIFTLLTTDKVYLSDTAVMHLESLPVQYGAAQRIGGGEEWYLLTTEGLFSPSLISPSFFIPSAKYVIDFAPRSVESLFLCEVDDELVAAMAFKVDSVWASSGLKLPVPFKWREIDRIQFLSHHQEFTQSVLAVQVNTELYIYSLAYTSSVQVFIRDIGQSFTFELCATQFLERSAKLCTSIRAKTIEIMALPQSIHIDCELASIAHSCSIPIASILRGPNLELEPHHPSLAVKADQEFFVTTHSTDTQIAQIHCFASADTQSFAVVSTGRQLAFCDLESGTCTEILTNEELVACEYTALTAVLLVRSGNVYLLDPHGTIALHSETFRGVTHLFTHLSLIIFATNTNVCVLGSLLEKCRPFPYSNPILGIFSVSDLICIHSPGKVDIYSVSTHQLYSTLEVSLEVIGVTGQAYRILTVDSLGYLSVYSSPHYTSLALLFRVYIHSFCTFMRFKIHIFKVYIICKDRIQLISMNSGRIDFFQYRFQTGTEVRNIDGDKFSVLGCIATTCEIRKWRIGHLSALLSISPSVEFAQEGSLSIDTQLTVSSSGAVVGNVPLNIAVADVGALVTVKKEWGRNRLNVPWDEEVEIELWEVFGGHRLSFSISSDAPINDISLIPSCSISYSLRTPCSIPNASAIDLQHNTLFCLETFQVDIYFFHCSESKCVHTAIGMIASIEVEIGFLADVAAIYSTNSTLILAFSGKTDITTPSNLIRTVFAAYDYLKKDVNVLLIEDKYSYSCCFFFVSESANLHHIFFYGKFFSHLSLSESREGVLAIAEQKDASASLMEIESVSSFSVQGEMRVLVLTAQQEVWLYRLQQVLTPINSFSISPRFTTVERSLLLLVKSDLLYATKTSFQLYSLPLLTLLQKINYPPQNLFNHAQVAVNEEWVALYTIRYALIFNLVVPPASALVCSFSQTKTMLSAIGNYRFRSEYIDFLHISTPSIRFLSNPENTEDSERMINITATNDDGLNQTVTITIVRQARRPVQRIIMVLIGLSVGIGCLWSMKRTRKKQPKKAEIELESLRTIEGNT